jgi:hypothetical protein
MLVLVVVFPGVSIDGFSPVLFEQVVVAMLWILL